MISANDCTGDCGWRREAVLAIAPGGERLQLNWDSRRRWADGAKDLAGRGRLQLGIGAGGERPRGERLQSAGAVGVLGAAVMTRDVVGGLGAGLRRAASTWVSPTSISRTGAAYLEGGSRSWIVAAGCRNSACCRCAAPAIRVVHSQHQQESRVSWLDGRIGINGGVACFVSIGGDWTSGRWVAAIGDSGGLSFDAYCCISLLDLASIWCAFCNKPGQDIHDGDEQSSSKLTRSKYWKA